MSSGLVRIAAGTLLSGAVFVGAGATPAFAAEGDDARDSDSSLQHNVTIKPQINIGTVNIAVAAANEGDGNATEADDNNANQCNGDPNRGDGNATEADDNATAVAVQEQRNNSITKQWNVNI
jgi:hypothetical protein